MRSIGEIFIFYILIPIVSYDPLKYEGIKYRIRNYSSDCDLFVRLFITYLPDPYFCRCSNVSMGNHTRLLCPGFFQPKPNHSGSRRARVPQTRIPNTDHSTERHPRPWSLLSRGHPAGSAPPLP